MPIVFLIVWLIIVVKLIQKFGFVKVWVVSAMVVGTIFLLTLIGSILR